MSKLKTFEVTWEATAECHVKVKAKNEKDAIRKVKANGWGPDDVDTVDDDESTALALEL
jgi:hypothetical protein